MPIVSWYVYLDRRWITTLNYLPSPTLSVLTQGSPRPTVCPVDTPSQTTQGWKTQAKLWEAILQHSNSWQITVCLKGGPCKTGQSRKKHKGNQNALAEKDFCASYVEKIGICLLVPKMQKKKLIQREICLIVCEQGSPHMRGILTGAEFGQSTRTQRQRNDPNRAGSWGSNGREGDRTGGDVQEGHDWRGEEDGGKAARGSGEKVN